jgi:tubulin epsilon
MTDRFSKLYRKKVYVHHYTQYLEEAVFQQSFDALDSLHSDYCGLMEYVPDKHLDRFKPLF